MYTQRVVDDLLNLVWEVGQEVLHYQLVAERKDDGSPVTQVDRLVEKRILDTLHRRFPNEDYLAKSLD